MRQVLFSPKCLPISGAKKVNLLLRRDIFPPALSRLTLAKIRINPPAFWVRRSRAQAPARGVYDRHPPNDARGDTDSGGGGELTLRQAGFFADVLRVEISQIENADLSNFPFAVSNGFFHSPLNALKKCAQSFPLMPVFSLGRGRIFPPGRTRSAGSRASSDCDSNNRLWPRRFSLALPVPSGEEWSASLPLAGHGGDAYGHQTTFAEGAGH
jgi:hypothetical protein